MRILCCVKPVPDTLVWNEAQNSVVRNRALSINSADCGALSFALELKKTVGAEITALSMAPQSAGRVLQDLFTVGADRIVLISDAVFSGSDSLATAKILSAAAARLGPFDLLLFGRRSSDGETGHVAAQTAQLLHLPCITNAAGLSLSGDRLECTRLLENETQTLSAALPCVVSVCGRHMLPPPSLSTLRAARGKTAEILTNRELRLPGTEIGRNSQTFVSSSYPVQPPEEHGTVYSDAQEGAQAIWLALQKPPAALPRRSETPELGRGCAAVVSLSADAPSAAAARELVGKAKTLYDRVILLDCRGSSSDDGVLAEAVADAIRRTVPAAVLFPATVRGRGVAPLCAARLNAGLTADCTELRLENGALAMIRPTFSGTLLADIRSRSSPCLASVRPGVFPAGDIEADAVVPVQPGAAERVTLLRSVPAPGGAGWDGRVILSGGRAIGGKEGFAALHDLAAKLGARVCASRAAVDSGYAPYSCQVGQTGAAVRPQFYIAFGISGAVQHMAGIRGGALFAVNTDRRAPIFRYADIGITAPWQDVLRALSRHFE